jgi:4'-phosphopantetheinyl transferase
MAPGGVGVWHADISLLESDSVRERSLAWLRPGERTRFDRYRGDGDRLMFLLGRVMARRLVGRALGIDPTEWRWREGPHGRPEIDDPQTPLHFNLAHSSGLVACAVAPDREVGVDVEDSERPPTDPAIVARFCSPDEAAAVRVGEPGWRDRFLEVWTLKEAYLKARGIGISVHLSDISFSIGDDVRVRFRGTLADADGGWAFRLVRATPRHLLAVATRTSDDAEPAVAIDAFPAAWLP